MNLDLRLPMGLMFSLVGVILGGFGLATRNDTTLYAKSLGINANLWWGIVLFLFGQTMFYLGRRAQKAQEKLPPPKTSGQGSPRRGH